MVVAGRAGDEGSLATPVHAGFEHEVRGVPPAVGLGFGVQPPAGTAFDYDRMKRAAATERCHERVADRPIDRMLSRRSREAARAHLRSEGVARLGVRPRSGRGDRQAERHHDRCRSRSRSGSRLGISRSPVHRLSLPGRRAASRRHQDRLPASRAKRPALPQAGRRPGRGGPPSAGRPAEAVKGSPLQPTPGWPRGVPTLTCCGRPGRRCCCRSVPARRCRLPGCAGHGSSHTRRRARRHRRLP